jgi:hypothetical protein
MNSSLTVIGAGHARLSAANGPVERGEEGETCAACCQVLHSASTSRIEVAWAEHWFEVPLRIALHEREKGDRNTQ